MINQLLFDLKLFFCKKKKKKKKKNSEVINVQVRFCRLHQFLLNGSA